MFTPSFGGMLAVIALLLSFFSFAVPFLPPFLKFDFTFIIHGVVIIRI